jgi:hypothetical protein
VRRTKWRAVPPGRVTREAIRYEIVRAYMTIYHKGGCGPHEVDPIGLADSICDTFGITDPELIELARRIARLDQIRTGIYITTREAVGRDT